MTQPNDQFQHPAGSIDGQKERRAAFLQRQRDAQKAFQQRIANAKGKSSRATTGDAGDNVEDLMAKRPVSPLPNPREQELQREIDLLKQDVAALSGQVRRMIPPQGLRELRPRIFPMTSDDDFATATEKLLSGDALIDHPGGRVFTIVDTTDLADSLGFGYEMVDTQDGHVKVVVIQGGGGESCNVDTPLTLGTSLEGNEAADTLGYDGSGDTPTGTLVYVLSRVVYKESGDKKLYGYYRAWLINSCGKVVAIGPEIRYEIFTTETCGTVDGGTP